MRTTLGAGLGPAAPWFGLVQPWLPRLGAGASLTCAPTHLRNSSTTTVTFAGTGTRWTTRAPDLSAAGVAGVSIGTVTVVTDTACHGPVTTGTAKGTVTWTDAGSGARGTQVVGTGPYADPHAATARVVGPDPRSATVRLASG